MPEELLERQIESWYVQCALVDRLYQEFARTYGVTGTALSAIQTLWSHPEGVTQQELCRRLNLPKQTVSNLVRVLEESGRIRRSRRESDQRCLVVTFTEAGRAFAQELLETLHRAESLAFAALSESDREVYTRVNETLTIKLREAMASRKEAR